MYPSPGKSQLVYTQHKKQQGTVKHASTLSQIPPSQQNIYFLKSTFTITGHDSAQTEFILAYKMATYKMCDYGGTLSCKLQ